MKFGMVEPISYFDGACNPGFYFINKGARSLLSLALGNPEFVSLPMVDQWNEQDIKNAKQCDALMLVGNPRYDAYTDAGGWLYEGLIDQMESIGLPMFDLWAGSGTSVGRSVDEDAISMLNRSRNLILANKIRRFAGAITRDSRTQRINEMFGIRSIKLPCCSAWSVSFVNNSHRCGRVIIPCRFIDDVDTVLHYRDNGWQVRVLNGADKEWCIGFGVESEVFASIEEMIDCFSKTEQLISYRLHSAIPAAMNGCRVSVIGSDTRMQACDAFGIPWSVVGEPVKAPLLSGRPHSTVDELREFINGS